MSAAHHLAVLAIEETGKAAMLKISQIYSSSQQETNSIERKLDNHYQKLFWALFLPALKNNELTSEDLKSAQFLARNIHEKRLASLYVSPNADEPILDIPRGEVEKIVRLAEARLGMEEAISADPPSPEHLHDLQWLLEAITDDEKRKLVFSKASTEKLQKDASVIDWIAWLKATFESQELENRQLAERELQRREPSDDEASQEKWLVKYRLICVSHSIRQKTLNWWNSFVSVVQLRAGDKKKRELLVEVRLPKAVSVQSLWYAGYGETRRFLLALNIGTIGFFWWYALNRENKFYEEITDLEYDARIELREQNKSLYVDWGHRALGEADLTNVALCWSCLPGPGAPEHEQRPFGEYLTALAFLAKTDMHLNLTPNACELFFRCLIDAMKLYGDLQNEDTFAAAFEKNLSWLIKQESDRAEFVQLAQMLDKASFEQDFSSLTLDKALQTKTLCDAYLLQKFQKIAEERRTDKAAAENQ